MLEYSHSDKRRKLLTLLCEAREMNPNLVLSYHMLRSESELSVHDPPQDIAEALNMNGADAFNLLNELGDDRCLILNYGRHGRSASMGLVNVRITGKGQAEKNRAIPASQEELWTIKQRLQEYNLDTALNHLNLAESAFDRREWEAANSQIRSCLEAVFDKVAEIKLGTTKTGGQARKELEATGLLPKGEARLVHSAFNVAGGGGSHAGMSSEDEARGRFLIALGVCYIGLSILS